jgi:hypothetical protein
LLGFRRSRDEKTRDQTCDQRGWELHSIATGLERFITASKAAMAAAEEKSSDANTRTHHPCGISMAAIRPLFYRHAQP